MKENRKFRSRKAGIPANTATKTSVSEKSGGAPKSEARAHKVSSPAPLRDGWRLKVGKRLRVEVRSARVDQGCVRGTLTVRRGADIHFRGVCNLTSVPTRAAVLKKLYKDSRIRLPERALLALEEACRRPRPIKKKPLLVPVLPPLPDLTLAGLEAVVRAWLLIEDEGYLPILVGVILAHGLPGDPVWMLVVAPPGGTKTEVLRALEGHPGMYFLSSLTARTLASGLDDPARGDLSLLARLTEEILVLKDFTTVLTIHHDERQAILSQLREVYDGSFDKAWGSGRELHWKGRLGFLAGVTPIIDEHHSAMSVLGERFVLLRPVQPGRRRLARAALRTAGKEKEMRQALANAMRGFLQARKLTPPAIPPNLQERLVAIADLVTRARSGVVRDGYGRGLEYAPTPEAPTRFAKVLVRLAQGIARAYDREAVTDCEIRLVARVALDCLPMGRRNVVTLLARKKKEHGTHGMLLASVTAELPGYSATYLRRTLEDLHALRVVERVRDGKAERWFLKKSAATVLVGLLPGDPSPDSSGKLSDPKIEAAL